MCLGPMIGLRRLASLKEACRSKGWGEIWYLIGVCMVTAVCRGKHDANWHIASGVLALSDQTHVSYIVSLGTVLYVHYVPPQWLSAL